MSKFADHKIRYRRADQLLSSVSDEWPNYDTENLIDPSQLIKIIRKVNKELGLRITKTKETIVKFDNWVVNLPQDCEHLNFAVLCGDYEVTYELPQGVKTENVSVDCNNTCGQVFITPMGDTYTVVQRAPDTADIVFTILKRVKIISNEYQTCLGEVTGKFLSANFLRLNIKSGTLYLNYEGVLEDDDGNLLVLDHPMVNPYYEYSIKHKILENMMFNGEDVVNKMQYIIPILQQSKKEAYNVTNMPEFQEIQEIIELNREAMYKKYYSIFI